MPLRIGCCTNMIAGGADKTGAEHIGLLAELGYDYVELPIADIMALDEQRFLQIAQMVKDSAIACECCNNFFPVTMRLTGPEADFDAAMDYVRRAAARAGALGAKIIVFGSGPAKKVPEGFPKEEAFHQLARLLSELSPVAAEYGITLAIEPLRLEECNIITSFREGCDLSDAVNRENVKVLVDYFHLSGVKEDPAHIASLGEGRLVHVHFARPEGRRFPADIGENAGYQPFIRALQSAHYQGRVSIEAYAGDIREEAAAGLRFMRAHFV